MVVRAVILDVDGTLVDTVDYHAEAWQRAFRHFGKEVEFQAIRNQIGKGGDQLMPVFISETEVERYGKELEKWRGDLFKREYMNRVKAFPKVREFFQKLRDDDKRIVFASSAAEDELENYKQITEANEFIEDATSADDAERSKPYPDIFRAALDCLGDVKAQEAIVIGDTPYDAEAAGKIDLRTIGLLSGGFPEATLRRAGVVAIYRSVAHLLEEYDQSPLAVG